MDPIREFRYLWRSIRYGNEIVYPPRAKQLLVEVADADLSALAFTADQGRFVKTIDRDITHLVALEFLRGTYCLKWGVSLSFVPHSWETKVRWHRTQKSARFDLFEAPAVASELPLSEFDLIIADGTHGQAFLRKDLSRLWKAQHREILDWFGDVTTLEAIVEKARAQRQAGPNWHSPSPGLVEAFTLAKLGHVDEGRALLDRVIEADIESLEPVEFLRAAFETITRTDSP
jgi:hypothetical protein